jgi:hypothetical protein
VLCAIRLPCTISLMNHFPSPAVKGMMNLTCNAWQASNTDGYFAVKGHWIEETSPSVWEAQEALLSFTHLNNSHNGKCLGQALFKIAQWLGIEWNVSDMNI